MKLKKKTENKLKIEVNTLVRNACVWLPMGEFIVFWCCSNKKPIEMEIELCYCIDFHTRCAVARARYGCLLLRYVCRIDHPIIRSDLSDLDSVINIIIDIIQSSNFFEQNSRSTRIESYRIESDKISMQSNT